MEFVGRVYENKFGFDITFNADDLDLLKNRLEGNGKVRIRLSFAQKSGKPYMAINDWKPEKKEEDETQQADSHDALPDRGEPLMPDTVKDDNLPF